MERDTIHTVFQSFWQTRQLWRLTVGFPTLQVSSEKRSTVNRRNLLPFGNKFYFARFTYTLMLMKNFCMNVYIKMFNWSLLQTIPNDKSVSKQNVIRVFTVAWQNKYNIEYISSQINFWQIYAHAQGKLLSDRLSVHADLESLLFCVTRHYPWF